MKYVDENYEKYISDIEDLVGKKILRIFMNEEYLKFTTDKGNIVYTVEGDCCSKSVFYDFIGVKKLLNNGPVVSVKEIPLEINNDEDKKKYQESIQCYGYEIVTNDPEFGEVTSVFSFRNYSNGYYGGSLEEFKNDIEVTPEIFDDILETEEYKRGEK